MDTLGSTVETRFEAPQLPIEVSIGPFSPDLERGELPWPARRSTGMEWWRADRRRAPRLPVYALILAVVVGSQWAAVALGRSGSAQRRAYPVRPWSVAIDDGFTGTYRGADGVALTWAALGGSAPAVHCSTCASPRSTPSPSPQVRQVRVSIEASPDPTAPPPDYDASPTPSPAPGRLRLEPDGRGASGGTWTSAPDR